MLIRYRFIFYMGMCLICGDLTKATSKDVADDYILLLDKRYIHKRCLDLSLKKLNNLHIQSKELKKKLILFHLFY